MQSIHPKTGKAANVKLKAQLEMARQARLESEKTCLKLSVIAAVACIVGVFVWLELPKNQGITSRDQASPLRAWETPLDQPQAETKAIEETTKEVVTREPIIVEPSLPEIVEALPETEVPAKKVNPLAGEQAIVMVGMDASRSITAERDKQLLQKAIEHGAWDAYSEFIANSIQSNIEKIGLRLGQGLTRYDEIWKQEILYRAILRWKTLSMLGEEALAEVFPDTYSAGFLLWLLDTPEAMEELLTTLHPADDPVAVLKFIKSAWERDENLREKYFPLAVACAVVFDRPMSIPNPIGGDYGSQSSVNPLERYQWYVDKNEAGKLAAPVHRSKARDLVWVVCAPVSTSELDWAIGKLHMHRKRWGETYGMIEYLMARAVEGVNPYEEYSFAEILKHGGICGDQTYFCVNTARAQGIPAMGLSGETSMGGHAWAAVKVDDREWDTSIGRIGGVSKGQASNPQIGSSITEQEVILWNDRAHQSENTYIKVHRHLWFADFLGKQKQNDTQAEVVRIANRIGSSFTETWQALYQILARETKLSGDPEKPENLDEWKSFVADIRREFRENPRMAGMATDAENDYIFPYSPLEDIRRVLLRERRRINRDSAEQADLITHSLKREADLIHQREGADGLNQIESLYDRALRDFGGSITGFKTMARDYFGFMRDEPEQARKAARDIELAFKRVVDTGTKDWFRAKTEAEIHRMICEFYRSAGDEKRAELLEKRVEVQMRRAKRSAL